VGRDAVAVLVWAFFLTGLTLGQFAFMAEPFSYGLLGGAALLVLLLAVGLFVRRRPAGERLRDVPELSYPAVAIAVGSGLALLGIPFGQWLWLPGLGLLALGAGALAFERRAGA
jgi:hypothetical protein